jgi:hypothetical protein
MEEQAVPDEAKSTLSRRRFLASCAAIGAWAGAGGISAFPTVSPGQTAERPWYRRAYRWGQTNINEMDPIRYDIPWWRAHWQTTQVQGLVINAGGIVAYYPSNFRLQYRAQYLGERDLYGELVRAAHADGIFVLARMDSNRAHEDLYRAHPDWFAVDKNGEPYRAGDRYVTCLDGPYYEKYLPEILREIIAWERPEGFTDNSWSGLDRNSICYCRYSRDKFRQATGLELPEIKNWDDPVYRQWIKWSYARRVAIWELNNRTTKDAGGPDCLWLGMIGGDLISQGRRFRDIKALCERTEMIMLDDQGRSPSIGFQENAEMGKRLHGTLGWDKLIPESMATYQRSPTFRKAAASPAESRLWMYAGFAGSIQPWWHHVGAFQWDRRQFKTAVPVYQWHAANERYLVDRTPVASVGVVYSQTNADFYGRDDANELVAQPYYGMIQALVRARIPYVPVHADHIEQYTDNLSLLILPNLAAMTDGQIEAVRTFVEHGGGLLATGETSLRDQWGDKRTDFALCDLFGAHTTGRHHGSPRTGDTWGGSDHSYIRLLPDAGKDVYGPLSGAEPDISGARHAILTGFEATDILSFGGLLHEVSPEDGVIVPMTYVPDFPVYPPETSWMRQPRTNIPAVVLNQSKSAGRCVYVPADIDRRFARNNLPDHGDLLANLIRWAVADNIPLRVEGKGLVDCHLYQQPKRLILHVVNLTSAGTWRSPVHDLIAIGPLQVSTQLPQDVAGNRLQFLVSGGSETLQIEDGWITFELVSLVDHEVIVVE